MKTESRRFALDCIEHENDHLKRHLFGLLDPPAWDSQGSHHSALVSLEAQDRSLEGRLKQLGNTVQREIDRFHRVQRKIEQGRGSIGCQEALYQETVSAEKRVRCLEDHKYQSNVTKGEAELECKSLRQSIDGLRRERILFEELQHKRKQELLSIAQEMASVVPSILSRIESKERTKRVLEQIRRQSAKEKEEWYISWRDQVQEMERFKRMEVASQERQSNERRARIQDLINFDSVRSHSSLHSSGSDPPSRNNDAHGTQWRSGIEDIEAVSTQIIDDDGPKTHSKVIQTFEALRTACMKNAFVSEPGKRFNK